MVQYSAFAGNTVIDAAKVDLTHLGYKFNLVDYDKIKAADDKFDEDVEAWKQVPGAIVNGFMDIEANHNRFFTDPNMTVNEITDFTNDVLNTAALVKGVDDLGRKGKKSLSNKIGKGRNFVSDFMNRFNLNNGYELVPADGYIPNIDDTLNGKTTTPKDNYYFSMKNNGTGGDDANGEVNPDVQVKVSKGGNVIIDFKNKIGNQIRFIQQNQSTIIDNIKQKVKNPKNEGEAIEAKVAEYVYENTAYKVTSFQQKVKNMTTGGPAGDIDVGIEDTTMNKYIIEVKKSTSAIDLEQVDKYTNINNKNYLNYDNKIIIYYIDEPIDMSDKFAAEKIEKIQGSKILIVNSLEELGGILK